MLDANVRTQLTGYLTKLQRPIELVASLDASEASGTMRALLEDIAACSSKVSVRFDGDASRRPSFSVAAQGEPARIRFAGLPLGHEFTSLVLALLHSGGHTPKADAATIEQIRAIALPAQFEVFVSLSCHNCPDVVQALNLIAALNPAVQTTMIDGALFQDEVTARDILAVPIVYRNGEVFGHGRMTLEEIVAKLDDGSNAARRAQALDARAPYDVLVVGGGPAGAAAAIYAARKGIRIGVVAERFGGQVLDTLGIENFVSIQQTEGPKLVADLEAHVQQHEVDLISQERVQALIPGEQGHALQLASGASLRAKSVVLATGARWRELGVPGEAEYKTKGVCFCPHCDGPLFKGKRVAVIGGGNSGVEAAIDLAGLVAHVTLIEYDTALRADAVLQNKLRSLTNVDVVLNARTTEVVGDGRKVVGMRYVDRASDEVHTCDVEGVFVQIGLLPNTDWLRGTVALSPRGEVEVDARGETSVPGVFAAGDCTTTPFKQIVIAVGEGAKASLSAFDHLMRMPVELRAVEAA